MRFHMWSYMRTKTKVTIPRFLTNRNESIQIRGQNCQECCSLMSFVLVLKKSLFITEIARFHKEATAVLKCSNCRGAKAIHNDIRTCTLSRFGFVFIYLIRSSSYLFSAIRWTSYCVFIAIVTFRSAFSSVVRKVVLFQSEYIEIFMKIY